MRSLAGRIGVLSFLCGLMLVSSGCARKMALSSKSKSLDLSKNSIALLTVKVSNTHVPAHQPEIYSVFVGNSAKKPRKYTFKADNPYIVEKKQYNEHLISLALPPGEYWLDSCVGVRRIPLLLCATCKVPVEKSFILEENEIAYIGAVDADIHKKQKGEKAAGSPFPLVDQAIAGFSTGGIGVQVYDNYNEDIQLFQNQYPLLQGYQISSALME